MRLLLLVFVLAAAHPTATDLASRIASVERKFPWLWSPSVEGLADLPYT
jgi:hypothetical protein